MLDHHRIVDEIRSFVQASDLTCTDSLKRLAAEYAEVCRETNERLRRCEEFLQKGLRSEAIHFAQAEPVLLDVVAVLDFPERMRWDEITAMYNLPAAQKMRIETAEALNRAYSEEQPLEDLLRKHRRLALARAPLHERLTLLRQVMAIDPGNPVWAEDVGAFERVRLQEMRGQLEYALSKNDMDDIFGLFDEMQNTRWTAELPRDLTEIFDREIPRRQHLQKRRRLEQIANELLQAYAVRDEARGIPLRDQWTVISTELAVLADDPLVMRAAPALRWLHRQEQQRTAEFAYQSAIAALERAFYEGADGEHLHSLYYEARKFKRRLPPELEERYRTRQAELQQELGRRERYILVTVFAIGAGILALLIIFLTMHNQ